MSGKRKIRILYLSFFGGLAVLAGIILVLDAAPVSNTVVKVKARFINGVTTILGDPEKPEDDMTIPNKILNDNPAAYYENVGNNILEIMDSSKQGKCIFLTIRTDQFSPRFVNLNFDSVVSPPGDGTGLPSFCTRPYFIYPQIIVPIGTVKLHMKVSGEWEFVKDPLDPDKIDTLQAKNSELNFLTMTDGQESYVYIPFFHFNVPDLTATKKVDESRRDYAFADCQWAKVKAWDWDGVKVNTWTLKPVTERFKHEAWDGSGNLCYHFEGAIPYMIYSNASLSCKHGTYRMPWELEITRR